jgi:hypothetical protein
MFIHDDFFYFANCNCKNLPIEFIFFLHILITKCSILMNSFWQIAIIGMLNMIFPLQIVIIKMIMMNFSIFQIAIVGILSINFFFFFTFCDCKRFIHDELVFANCDCRNPPNEFLLFSSNYDCRNVNH